MRTFGRGGPHSRAALETGKLGNSAVAASADVQKGHFVVAEARHPGAACTSGRYERSLRPAPQPAERLATKSGSIAQAAGARGEAAPEYGAGVSAGAWQPAHSGTG